VVWAAAEYVNWLGESALGVSKEIRKGDMIERRICFVLHPRE
jgi:hypothetical protein